MKWGKGKEYLAKSLMRTNVVWDTETEILATAKLTRRDVFTFHREKLERFLYKHELSKDALYIDNRQGRHFDVVLEP